MSESGITLHAHLPLAWAATASFPQPLIAEWMHGNLVCLQALAALESHDREIDASATGEHAAGRLEAKVDLLLQLVGELMRKQQPAPPRVEVILGADEVIWDAATPIAAGSEGVLTLFLSPRLHWPLTFPVHVTGVQGTKVHAKLIHLSEDAQEWLERTLFRYHRRALHSRPR
ncbi:MAG: PilZ domain-containing protein [Hydrogenophilales bacterium]|nr:PilZ domain-containing protein [Hydrogenophilales bacterium]